MDVLVTGPYGRVGTAIIDNLHDEPEYEFTYLNRSDRDADHPYGQYETVVADVGDFEAIRPAFEDVDAVIHLAAYPYTDGTWDDILEPNVVGTYNVLEAAREAEVDSVVFGSTNHVMGMYEEEFAPELYELDFDLALSHEDPVRPDSYYGTSKVFGEALCRQYVERYEYPKHCYMVRICSVRHPEYDHPYGDAERAVDEGELERGSEEYDRQVRRMKAMWQSRHDFAHQVECCLRDEDVEYGVFNGVSDNDRRWFSIENARHDLGYDPQDNGEEWGEPPN
ncbi:MULTISPECIES: NAD-dependent epimerase/dehydratase family protein [Haloferacaceae]|uniref:NAD-dependent epimerase/dehydratase family protein n=1 Tax=Halorubrum glutamatedens TaxID=2707018 RepID=A0ABD5QR57_9EURY|nr:NAD(P)-dependent oxidoreductase [Halobellus captivus]